MIVGPFDKLIYRITGRFPGGDGEMDDYVPYAMQMKLYAERGYTYYCQKKYAEAAEGYRRALIILYTAVDSGDPKVIDAEAKFLFYLGLCECEGAKHDYYTCLSMHLRAINLLECIAGAFAGVTNKLALLHLSVAEILELFDDDEGAAKHYAAYRRYASEVDPEDGPVNFYDPICSGFSETDFDENTYRDIIFRR